MDSCRSRSKATVKINTEELNEEMCELSGNFDGAMVVGFHAKQMSVGYDSKRPHRDPFLSD